MLRGNGKIRHTVERISSSREHVEKGVSFVLLRVVVVDQIEADADTVGRSDPIALHTLDLLRPSGQIVESVVERVGKSCDA